MNNKVLKNVPTNIITGFLGVGKTTAIINLLKTKPADERWAVLVNEFGEIGVDGSLFAGNHPEQQGVYIREVPGGCMCCSAGLPMQIALNQLLARAQPDRLLIEPTGLGHPVEVLQVLGADCYHGVLALQRTITLVDARKLADERYTSHATFNQQIAIADLIVGNKTDLYAEKDAANLRDYVQQHGLPGAQIEFAQQGKIDPELLKGQSAFQKRLADAHHHNHEHEHEHEHKANKQPATLLSEQAIPESGLLKALNQGEGFQSAGWRFAPNKVFDRQKLFSVLSGLLVERMKAVFITQDGVMAYNLTEDTLTEFALDESSESRIELIYRHTDEGVDVAESLEQDLIRCVL